MENMNTLGVMVRCNDVNRECNVGRSHDYLRTLIIIRRGGRSSGSAGAALPERSGSSTKGRTSNIRYFVAKPSIVAIYALF